MTTKQVLRGVGAAGLALVLTACMKLDMGLEINTDDTVDGSIVLAFSKEFIDMAESMGDEADMDSLFEDFMELDADGEGMDEYTSVEPYEDDEFIGQQLNLDGAPLEEFAGSDQTATLSIVHEGDEFVLDGNMDMTDAAEADMQDLPSGLLEGLDFDMRVAVTFPGEVLEHNGSLDGTTVTWEPQIGESNEMFARSLESGGGGDGVPVWLWIVIGLVVLGALVGLLFMLSRGRGSGAGDTAETASVAGENPEVGTPSAASAQGPVMPTPPPPAGTMPPPGFQPSPPAEPEASPEPEQRPDDEEPGSSR